MGSCGAVQRSWAEQSQKRARRHGPRHTPARGGSGAPPGGPWLARETPAGCPRHTSPAWAIALLGGALAGSGPETSPCIDGLSLVSGMVVPSTLRVQTTPATVAAVGDLASRSTRAWRREARTRGLRGGIRTRWLRASSAVILATKAGGESNRSQTPPALCHNGPDRRTA
jgi:hypothetical protein